jgi:hypothetical protein
MVVGALAAAGQLGVASGAVGGAAEDLAVAVVVVALVRIQPAV